MTDLQQLREQARAKLDNDTRQFGVEPPFKDWEHDHTGLVHVLWAAKHRGLSLSSDTDEIASMIMHSRWLAAQKALPSG